MNDKPTSPRTEAGMHEYSERAIADALLDKPITLRAGLVHSMLSFLLAAPYSDVEQEACNRTVREVRAAIEREAAAATPSLDVERLAVALENMDPAMVAYFGRGDWKGTPRKFAADLAAEYARLDEGSKQ